MVLFLNGISRELKLKIAGKVVRQDDNGVGVHFEEMNIDTSYYLKSIIAYNADEHDQLEDELVWWTIFLKNPLTNSGNG